MVERRRFQIIPKDGVYQVLLDGVDIAHSVSDISIWTNGRRHEVTLTLVQGKTELDLPSAEVTIKESQRPV